MTGEQSADSILHVLGSSSGLEHAQTAMLGAVTSATPLSFQLQLLAVRSQLVRFACAADESLRDHSFASNTSSLLTPTDSKVSLMFTFGQMHTP